LESFWRFAGRPLFIQVGLRYLINFIKIDKVTKRMDNSVQRAASPPSIPLIGMIKSRSVRYAGLARMGEKINAYILLVGKPE
jgi:hypothetical protein